MKVRALVSGLVLSSQLLLEPFHFAHYPPREPFDLPQLLDAILRTVTTLQMDQSS